MARQISESNVVITSVVSLPMLVTRRLMTSIGVFSDDEVTAENIVANELTQVSTNDFDVIVLQDRIQINLKCDEISMQKTIEDKLGKIVTSLPENVFQSLGFNLGCKIKPESESTEAFSKKFFYNSNSSIYESFGSSDAKYGAYISKNFEEFRLKMNALPMRILNIDPQEELFIFSFNFHTEFQDFEKKHQHIALLLSKWNVAFAEAKSILAKTEV